MADSHFPIPPRWRRAVTSWRCVTIAAGLVGIASGANFYTQNIGERNIGAQNISAQSNNAQRNNAQRTGTGESQSPAASPNRASAAAAATTTSSRRDMVNRIVRSLPSSDAPLETEPKSESTGNSSVPVGSSGVVAGVEFDSHQGAAVRAEQRRAQPVLLAVPAAQINVALDRLYLDAKGEMIIPTDARSAGWWRKKRPSSPLVLVGHFDSKTGPAVFFHVNDLRFGDRVFVTFDDGSNASYTVRQIERVDKDRFPSQRVYNEGKDEIRLVTCGGKFNRRTGHYEDNVVVYATPDNNT